MRSYLGAAFLALCLTGGTTSQLGCSPCDVSGQTAIEYTAGKSNASKTIFETGEVDEEMLHFPQGRRYKIAHHLGRAPEIVNIYLSFRKELAPLSDPNGDPTDKNQPNNVAPTAGNQAVIEAWDDEFVQIRNDTCANFYVRLVAFAAPDDMGAAGAAGAATN